MKPPTVAMDRSKVRVGEIKELGNDLEYWLTKSPQERLDALESIRREYNDWKYGPEQRLQRVCRIIKQK